MSITLLAFRRRSEVERKVIQIVRGETVVADRGGIGRIRRRAARFASGPNEYERVDFVCLREFARRNGCDIQAAGSPYLTSGELVLLRWLAEAQREAGLRTFHCDDPGFEISLGHCAGILRKLGLHLAAHTLHICYDLPASASARDTIVQ